MMAGGAENPAGNFDFGGQLGDCLKNLPSSMPL